jgi:hypothetical protein
MCKFKLQRSHIFPFYQLKMKLFKYFIVLLNIYVGLSILVMVLKPYLPETVSVILWAMLSLLYCVSFSSLGYIATYFREQKWIQVVFYGFVVSRLLVFVSCLITGTVHESIFFITIVANLALVIASTNIGNSFLRPYCRRFALVALLFIMFNTPGPLAKSQHPLAAYATGILQLIPALFIVYMLHKIIQAIKAMEE